MTPFVPSPRRRPVIDRTTRLYIGAVSLAGWSVLAALGVTSSFAPTHHQEIFFALLALAIGAELLPIRVTFRNDSQEFTLSTTFVFATMLVCNPAAAIGVQAFASGASDLVGHKPWWKIAFNIGQYTLAWAAAAAVLVASGFVPGSLVDTAALLPIALAGITFHAVNSPLVHIAVARTLGVSPLAHIRRDFVAQQFTALVLLSLAPIVAVVADTVPVLVPLFVLPIAAVYIGARVSQQKDHQSRHDALTHLPNRILFQERVDQVIESRADARLAVFIVDLDSFKDVNDTLGHHMGDLLLRELADRLAAAFDATDAIVARLGGDEFALAAAVHDHDDAARLAHDIQRALELPIDLEGLTVTVGGSVGAAWYPDHGTEVGGLLQRADVAMYIAKEHRSGFELYSPEHDPHTTRRLSLLSDLQGAIDDRQLVLCYQPIAAMTTGAVVAAEALVRWRHPVHGLVMPDEFIPLTEPTGLIGPLTEYVLAEALAECARWRRDGHDLRVAVNISVRNLYETSFARRVEALLRSEQLPASVLELEVTEGMVMADPVRALRMLEDVHDLGVSIALDDFGTGYSSLSYLQELPVDRLKIDRSFVAPVGHGRDEATIVRAVIDLARHLELEVVAEGVETLYQWETLRRLGCNLAQGYFLGRPGPPEQILHTRLISPRVALGRGAPA